MIVGTVKLSAVLAAGRLDAEFYLCPTKSVDEKIASRKREIASKRRELRRLRLEREQIAADAVRRGLQVEPPL